MNKAELANRKTKMINFMRNLLKGLKANGGYGLLVIRQKFDKDIKRKITNAKTHVIFDITDTDNYDIENFLDEFAEMLDENTADSFANWFFSEITSKTKNLPNKYKHVQNKDFIREAKHLIYYDFDLKDVMAKSDLATLSEDKRIAVLKQNPEVWNKIIDTHPAYISFTGNGFHIGYLLHENKVVINNEKAYTEAYEAIGKDLEFVTNLKFDSACKNPARIDRIPWSINVKETNNAHDKHSKLLYINVKPSYSITNKFLNEMSNTELTRVIDPNWERNVKVNMYTGFRRLTKTHPMKVKYLKSKLTFEFIFDKLGITDIIGYQPQLTGEKELSSCFSPFRSILVKGDESQEQKASFRYNDTNRAWFDFGETPIEGAGVIGDTLGLMYAVKYKQLHGEFPVEFDSNVAYEWAMGMIDPSDSELNVLNKIDTEALPRDDDGNLIPDFKQFMRFILTKLLRRYTLVFHAAANTFMYHEKQTGAHGVFKQFPLQHPWVGGKKDLAAAQTVLNECGVPAPTKTIVSLVSNVMQAIVDTQGIRTSEDKKYAYFDYEGVSDIKIPVTNMENPVLKFLDGTLFSIRKGGVITEYDGFAYEIPVEFPTKKYTDYKSVYWEALLTGLVGNENDVRRKILNYLFGAMWFPVDGNSRAVVLLGDGRNGKSTLAEVLHGIMPKGSVFTGKMSHLVGESSTDITSRLDLAGKLIGIVSDMDNYKFDLGLKSLITGDKDGVAARSLFKNTLKFTNTASFLLNANSLPSIRQDVYAFLRRFLIIRTNNAIPAKDIIPNLDKHIIEEELQAVWAYIIEAIQTYRSHNYSFPEDEGDYVEYLKSMSLRIISKSPIGKIVINSYLKQGVSINVAELYISYKEYTKEQFGSHQVQSFKNFTTALIATLRICHRFDILKDYEEDTIGQRIPPEERDGVILMYVNEDLHTIFNVTIDTDFIGMDALNEHVVSNVDIVNMVKYVRTKYVELEEVGPRARQTSELLKSFRNKYIEPNIKG